MTDSLQLLPLGSHHGIDISPSPPSTNKHTDRAGAGPFLPRVGLLQRAALAQEATCWPGGDFPPPALWSVTLPPALFSDLCPRPLLLPPLSSIGMSPSTFLARHILFWCLHLGGLKMTWKEGRNHLHARDIQQVPNQCLLNKGRNEPPP